MAANRPVGKKLERFFEKKCELVPSSAKVADNVAIALTTRPGEKAFNHRVTEVF